MLKFLTVFSFILIAESAQAAESPPWFGSAAADPERVKLSVKANSASKYDQNPDCTIYSCSTLVKIAKPEKKSASNP